MRTIRVLLSVFAWTAALWCVPRQAPAQQQPIAALLAEARRQLDELNPDSAGSILVGVLDLGAGATRAERVRALVLLGIAELMLSDRDKARLDFQQALALDPQLRVDSLADLQSFVLATFGEARLAAAGGAELRPAILEILNAPASAEVRIDGARWEVRRDTVRPGLHLIQVVAAGYVSFVDSVMVDSGTTVRRDATMRRAAPADVVEEQHPMVPSVVPAAQPPVQPVEAAAAHREGSIELSAGLGLIYGDQVLFGRLHDPDINVMAHDATGRILPGAVLGATYNLNEKLGVGLGTGIHFGRGATALSPFLSGTYTMDLNQKMSPFVTAGLGMTRYSGNGTRLTSTIGAYAGVGVRSMMGEKLALRFEVRVGYESWEQPPYSGSQFPAFPSSSLSSTLIAGLSYFMGGTPAPGASFQRPGGGNRVGLVACVDSQQIAADSSLRSSLRQRLALALDSVARLEGQPASVTQEIPIPQNASAQERAYLDALNASLRRERQTQQQTLARLGAEIRDTRAQVRRISAQMENSPRCELPRQSSGNACFPANERG